MQIVGFAGYARVGKDTAALALPEYVRCAFADELKHDVRRLLVQNKVLSDDLSTTKELTRPLMVEYGRLCRSVDPSYWIMRLCRSATWHLAALTGRPVVVTDVRYLNEAQWILAQGGKVIYLQRPGKWPANIEEGTSIIDIQKHLSLPTVFNDGTVEELHAKVRALVGGK